MKSKNTYIVEWDEVHHHRLAVLAKDTKTQKIFSAVSLDFSVFYAII